MSTRTVHLVDHSIASLTGSSQNLVPQDMTRVYLHIANVGNANVGINLLGGTAAIGTFGTIVLTANGSITYNTGSIPGNAISIIGTAGQPITCVTSP